MKALDVERIGGGLAIVIRGTSPYTICRCTRWELWKMAIKSMFR